MRVTMIHAIAESIPPVRMALGELFPEAQVVNVLDEGLLLDFEGQLTPKLRRRMTDLICYYAEHGADAIGLACSVYAPVVEAARTLVDVPLVSSYGPVMAEAVSHGRRVGIIASVPATLRDAEYYLRQTARELGVAVEPQPCLVGEDLFQVIRTQGEAGLRDRLAQAVAGLATRVDSVVLSQFSMAPAVAHLRKVSPVPVLSAPHSSARRIKELLSAPVPAASG
jgi:Asp/Glu/hydantoin racemase